MSDKEVKVTPQESGSELEHVFEKVPDSARKSASSILVILTGYTISLSNFVTGATVGFKCLSKRLSLPVPWATSC